jgi:tRNA (guanine37-N1)-methyltransferase
MTTLHIITLFPDAFISDLSESIIKRAQEDKKIKIKFYNPPDFSKDKWARVDDKPYRGGPGMVIQALPVIKAIEKAKGKKRKVKIIFLSPSGKQFTNEYAKEVGTNYKDIIILSGRYEGIDDRFRKFFKVEDISVGPFILTGGELPAMILVDCISRQVEGVLGNFNSLEESRVSSSEVYTRPEVLKYKGKTLKVPKVLLSGNHKKIEEWKGGKR